MVSRLMTQIIVSLTLTISLTSCSLTRSFWGEKAPPRKTVTVQSKPLPDLMDLFHEEDAIAIKTLDEYENFILSSFDQIEGKNKNSLTIEELTQLARAGFAKLSDDQETSIRRIRSSLAILGYRQSISRSQIQELLNWIRINRKSARSFYRSLKNYENEEFNSNKLIDILHFAGSFIRLGGSDSIHPHELEEMISPWIPEKFIHARKALPSGIALLNGIFASLCGDRIDAGDWNAAKNGKCLIDMTDHFASTAPVFDLIFNKINPIQKQNELRLANGIFVQKINDWLQDHHHPAFETRIVAEFANQMEIPSPYHFFQLTEWLPKLNSESTPEKFNPMFFIKLARIVQNWTTSLQVAIEDSENQQPCYKNDWSKCPFQGKYDPADRLFNDEYATLIRVKDLGFVYKVSMFDAISKELFITFDHDQNGKLQDNLTDLITVIVRLLDSNAFAMNVVNRVLEKPITPKNTEASMSSIKRMGLAEVAALASDLIPNRGSNQRTILKKIASQVYDSERNQNYALDQLGMTTFLYIYDLLTDLRKQSLDTYAFEPVQDGTTTWIKRSKIMELLPRFLKSQFPRIFEECQKQGFERTCGVIYSEVLASAEPGKDVVEPIELDTLNLTSILLESMMNRCDRDHDGWLSATILDGYDEKDCILTVSRTLVTRLMNANIIDDERRTRVLLKIMRWTPPVQWAAKVALQRGTLKGISWRAAPPVSMFSRPATLGSVMSLAAEFMDPAKTEAIDAGIDGPLTDPGDEWIYRGRLTQSMKVP
jgi:hypothetical protein